MVRFLTISPTDVLGKKPYAWDNFRSGKYVALGWLNDCDLRDEKGQVLPLGSIIRLIKEHQPQYRDEKKAIYAHTQFYQLDPGDYVAVNNVNHGLFGVGRVRSAYQFGKNIHDSGNAEKRKWYSHYREVEWIKTTYVTRKQIVRPGEKEWRPYGAVGRLEKEIPPYIRRYLAGAF
jgi:hypothetical protein